MKAAFLKGDLKKVSSKTPAFLLKPLAARLGGLQVSDIIKFADYSNKHEAIFNDRSQLTAEEIQEIKLLVS